MSEEQGASLLENASLTTEQRQVYERLLNVRGLMIKDTTELVALTSLSSVYYLLLTCDYDILVSDKNWSVFVDYVRKCSIEVNSGCELDPYPHDACLPFSISFPFILSILIKTDRVDRAVELWNTVLGCCLDVCHGLFELGCMR